MPIDERMHNQRGRAESFGTVAGDYDRYRPSYPSELINDLAALRPRSVLDVGCGTGKAARLLTERGLSVLGIEIDPQMAEVARRHGVEVEVAAFERWPDRGRAFDLITCAQAWHWIDPDAGAHKAARLLQPAGKLALFWNFEDLLPEAQRAVDGVYEQLAPELHHARGGDPARRVDQLRSTLAFARVTSRTYRWTQAWSVDEWVGRVGTHSDHLALGDRLPAVLDALRKTLSTVDAEVHASGGTFLILAGVDTRSVAG